MALLLPAAEPAALPAKSAAVLKSTEQNTNCPHERTVQTIAQLR
jgi:hypothetical protein